MTKDALGVGLAGRRVRLERVRAKHVPALHRIAQTPGWPLVGAGLTLDGFAEQLWSLSPVQFSVVRLDTDELIGSVHAHRWDQRSGTADVVFGIAPDYWRMLWPIEGVAIFCDYLFRGLGVRKVYFELSASTLDALGSGVRRWCVREWVNSGQVVTPDADQPQDIELWALTNWDAASIDRFLGRPPNGGRT